MSRETLLQSKAHIEAVQIEGVEEVVHIRAPKMGRLRAYMADENGDELAVQECVCDEAGAPLLKAKDVAELPSNIFRQLAAAVVTVSGYGSAKN